MQTEVPTLPVVHFNVHKNPDRKQNSNLKKSTVEAKTNVPHRNTSCFTSNKKNLHPLLGQPYQNSIRQQSSEHTKHKKNCIEQRVLSAKMLRVKELQNQLADAHYQLNELANENRLLKALQKRQDSALKRYEGTNAELPRIINSHHEELRVLQIKYKKLKVLHKETCDLLKEKEHEFQQLQSQNKHLLQLSKDRNLGEREKLQLQVSDLNHRIEQQQDTIQMLHRKLTLESKSLKHQLHTEISKRKETQKNLEETIEKLKSLEHLLDNRERRLYYNGQLLQPSKNRHLGTQSLTNLRDISSSNPLKLSDRAKKWQTDTEENSLPVLHVSDLNDKTIKTDDRISLSQTLNSMKTETMANLDQIRKYRLQKSSHSKISLDDTEEKPKELSFKMYEHSERLEIQENEDRNEYELNADEFRAMYRNQRYQDFNELAQEELAYSSESSDNENKHFKDNSTDRLKINNSKKLRRRLISSADDTSDSKELTFSNCKCRDKLKVLVQEREDSYKSDSEAESEVRKDSIDYLSTNYQNDNLSPSSTNNEVHYNSDKEIQKLTASCFVNESQKIYKNLISDMQVQIKNVESDDFYSLQYDHTHIEQVDTDHLKNDTNISSEDSQKSSYIKQGNDDIDIEKNKVQDAPLLETSIKTSDSKKLRDIELEKLSQEYEIHYNDSNNKALTNSLITLKELNNEQKINLIHTNETELMDKNISTSNSNIENKLNNQEINEELENVDHLLNNGQSCETDSIEASNDIDINAKDGGNTKKKVINYNKEKLLATMRAIDDNENIEFLNQDYSKHNIASRKQITENLFRGLPTHAKKKQDIIKDIFETSGIRNEAAGSCNKLH
ncbi:uncharacterized protein LOC143187078 [Calliopsis andreniformis]|uniref:uncharacterized protein LOC143187078 n=1 Tax=Calliopsis andreniformis TaxID=337506 RepID=UPI003FCD5DB6